MSFQRHALRLVSLLLVLGWGGIEPADAARCYVEANQLEAARALSDRVADEAPSIRLPEHIRSQRRELLALGSL